VHVQIPEERVLPAPERVIGHGHGDRDIHADHTGGHVATEAVGGSAIDRKDDGAVAVVTRRAGVMFAFTELLRSHR
jgi:hypothetical protein